MSSVFGVSIRFDRAPIRFAAQARNVLGMAKTKPTWAGSERLRPLLTPIDTLTLDPDNARDHGERSIDGITASLRKFGQRKPIVVNASGKVIAGNGTFTAARRLGWSHIATTDVDGMSEDEARAFALVDNRTAELSVWNNERLAIDLPALALSLPDLDLGWTAKEIRQVEVKGHKRNVGTDDVPDAPTVPTSKIGDVWLCGRHRVMCGDSTDGAAWARLMGADKARMVWTDPPYGVAYVGKTEDALEIDNDRLDAPSLRAFLAAALGHAFEACHPGAAWYVTSPPGDLFLEFAMVLGREGLGVWRHTLAWVKDRFVLGHSDYHYRHEPILYGWRPGAAHFFVADRTLDSVFDVPRPSRNAEHPTMKPVELVARCIRNSTEPDWIVVDAFGGSGTTVIACEQESRVARAMELSPAYVDVTVRRWEAMTGQTATLEQPGPSS